MYRISPVPKIIYLDDEISVLDMLCDDLTNIILEYFYECKSCNHHFDEELIEKCKCASWCNYCSKLYIISGFCNSCKDKNETINMNRKYIRCHHNSCDKNAIFGNELYPFYCYKHSSDKLLISYYFKCMIKDCINIGQYVDAEYDPICSYHENSDCTLMYKEGDEYISEVRKFKCHNCKKNILIKYKCNCGIIRCTKCIMLNSFIFKYNGKTILACNECIYKFNIKKESCNSINFYTNCDVNNCTKKGCYYNPMDSNYFCDFHFHKEFCVSLEKKCKYQNCLAICTVKSKYCHFHHSESIKYNFSSKFF